ncbi:PREDICTED: atypical chemokine receptor 1-like [Thamnophis sirtalis]|uniref:Atypical chemokine receptor 1 n=1 Tax=Thamnophis sirtalis TaxID=35019 RepID=A0A6I9X6P6_9SAUR|nr:PREDICTED: atypical chemokine receptor 1-like [Thamnophis sirtalis]
MGNSTVYDYTILPDLWQLMDNVTENETEESGDWYENFVEPCQFTFCSNFVGTIPVFLGITCLLGIVGNVALGVALAKCPRFWDRCQPGKVELALLAIGGLIFASTLPFFALGIRWRWAFEDRVCQAIHGLKFGSLFAGGLLAAGTACRNPWGPPKQLLPALLWTMGFVCAIPAALVSSSDGLCIPPRLAELHAWSFVHATSCLVILALLPVIVVSATACLAGCGERGRPRWNISWVFYLFWAPYGVAVFVEMFQKEIFFSQSCRFLDHLNSFLRLSEGWGMLHCYLSPFFILGLGFYRRKTA